MAVKWSGIEIATEYPFPLSPELDSNNEGEAVEERHQPGVDIDTSVDEKQILVHAATVLGERQWLGGRSHGQLVRGGRTVTNKQNLWYLAGPLDSMSSLPIAPTKQNAILIHTCKCTDLADYRRSGVQSSKANTPQSAKSSIASRGLLTESQTQTTPFSSTMFLGVFSLRF